MTHITAFAETFVGAFSPDLAAWETPLRFPMRPPLMSRSAETQSSGLDAQCTYTPGASHPRSAKRTGFCQCQWTLAKESANRDALHRLVRLEPQMWARP